MEMDFESIFRYSGMLLCIISSIYLYLSGSKYIATLFLLSLILQFQSALYAEFASELNFDGIRECLTTGKSFYSCLPLSFKLSTHGGQFGLFVMAFAIYSIAKGKKSWRH